jgi:hypothetical protein
MISWLILFTEINAVYSDNYVKPIIIYNVGKMHCYLMLNDVVHMGTTVL